MTMMTVVRRRRRRPRYASGRGNPEAAPGGCMGCWRPWSEGKVPLPLD